MRLESGLLDHMVLQRDEEGGCNVCFKGHCKTVGSVELRILRNGRTMRGFGWTRVGNAERRRFDGRMRDLKTGGPYDVELRIVDDQGTSVESLNIADILVGDVWVLAGQSNMEGGGDVTRKGRAVDEVRAFYMNDRWAPAKVPVTDPWIAVDPVHGELMLPGTSCRPAKRSQGPGVSFGQHMHEVTGVPQGLLACAHGGTSMAQWDPALKHLRGRSLFGAAVRRIRKNGSRVAGVLWYQGESEASAQQVASYTAEMTKLIRAFRTAGGGSQLPFVLVQLSRHYHKGDLDEQHWNAIQEQQRLLGLQVKNCAAVPAIDLDLIDGVHLDGSSQVRLGARLAHAALALKGSQRHQPPMRLKRVREVVDTRQGFAWLDLEVAFDNVCGKLVSQLRPEGFAISDSAGRLIPAVCRTELHNDRVLVKTCLSPWETQGLNLHYGYGSTPYCSILDEADRSLPVLGPVPIAKSRALSPFVRKMEVSNVAPLLCDIAELECPQLSNRKLGWRRRRSSADFFDVHGLLATGDKTEKVVLLAARFECPSRMKLKPLLGYDGPIKVWVDGRNTFCDHLGTNPAQPDEAGFLLDLTAGRHEIMLALASNSGNTYGVYLRFEYIGCSNDISKDAYAKIRALL